MRFTESVSRLFLLVLSVGSGASAVLTSRTFGADFSQPISNEVYVQGGYTIVDNANFINTGEIEGKIGTLTNVRWQFKITPTNPPPSSVFVKVLRQKSGEPWRFSMVDQREIITRPQNVATETKSAYQFAIEQFWKNPAGINLNSLPAGFQLKTPGVAGPAPPLNIRELDFVGFYFPDLQSQVASYESKTPVDAIEWAMPGNFDWPYEPTPHWSPNMRFTFPAGHAADDEVCANQATITNPDTHDWTQPIVATPAGTYPTGLENAKFSTILNWQQYRNICDPPAFEASNIAIGYEDPAFNEANWKEGFVSRAKHRDFFQFKVTYDSGGAPPCTNPGGCGDPQFIGFQGQNFQFHGMADEVFNLISTPTFQMNGNFKYISAGKCDYNDTACFTHPGTYVDQIGFMIGDIKIKAVSGSHEKGLRAWMNDIEIHRANAASNHKIIFAINNSTTETGSFQYTQTGRIALDLPQFHVEIINSDYFFNMEVSIKDANVLRAGAKQVKLREKVLCASEGMKSEDRMAHVESRMAKHYPRVPIHGLIGQTWRNALICDHPWVGDASDYVTSSLFASDSAFNYFGTQQ